MTEKNFIEWSQLHLRVSRNLTLSEAERLKYEAGMKQLHEAEPPIGDVNRLRALREQIAGLESEQSMLVEHQQKLTQEIALLESMLGNRTRGALGLVEAAH